MNKKVIVFCSPVIDFLVSTDVISQYLFFNNTKDIFFKNNYEILYFYDLLDSDESIKYKNINENYKYDNKTLIKQYKNDRNKILKVIIENNEYDDCIIIGLESIGFDIFFYPKIYVELKKKNIIIIISIYDPHAFSYTVENNYDYFNITDIVCNLTSYIITSSYLYFKNIEWVDYHKKCRKTYLSFNSKKINLDSVPNFNMFFNRRKKILLNGSISQYKYRHIIYNLIMDNEYYIINNTIYPENIIQFKEIVQYENIIKFNRDNNIGEGGINYCKFISNFMGYFILFGNYPIDFPLAKILECMLAGCLAFIEPKKYLYEELGLIEYVHYVPILINDKKDKIILDIEYYNKYLNTELGLSIAKKGYEFIRNNFNDEKISLKYINTLNDILNNTIYIFVFTDSNQHIFINDTINEGIFIYTFKIIKIKDENFEKIINDILSEPKFTNCEKYYIFSFGNKFKFYFSNETYFDNLINNLTDIIKNKFNKNMMVCELIQEEKNNDNDYLIDLLIEKKITIDEQDFFLLSKNNKNKHIQNNLINLKNEYGTYNEYIQKLKENNLKLKTICDTKNINFISKINLNNNINNNNELYIKIIENITKCTSECENNNFKIIENNLNNYNELINKDLLKNKNNIKFYQPHLINNYNLTDMIIVNIINNHDNKNNSSFGISFKLNEHKIINNKLKCRLFFQAKIDSNIQLNKLKIYTGYEWIILDEIINNQYQDFEIIEYFNFNILNYRIGFVDWTFEYLNFILKNISLKYILC